MSEKDKDRKVVTETLSDSLSDEELKEIVNKEWNVVELPLDEDIEAEEKRSPMSRNNVNSRKNLAQYQERDEESKEASLKNLRKRKAKTDEISEEEVDRIKNKISDKFEAIIPVDDLFEQSDRRVYYKALDTYLSDFEDAELSVLDLDDIQNLALNKVWILKLMGLAHTKPKDILEISASIDRYKRDSIKIKESLAVRRKDRIDPRVRSSISILDIAENFDNKARKEKLELYNEDEQQRLIYKKRQEKLLDNDD